MERRIEELEVEINEFQSEIQKKNNLIQQVQNEIQQLIQGILTRQGGIIELKKFMEIKDESDSSTNMQYG